MQRYNAILFDLGNTLVYRIVTQERTLRLLCDECSFPLKEAPDWPGAVAIWRAYHASHYLAARTVARELHLLRREAELVLRNLCDEAPEPADVARLAEGLRQSTRWWGVYDDVSPLLDTLKCAGLSLGLISNWEPSLEEFCAEIGLAHAFRTIVSSVKEGVEKPSPRIFEIALERLGVEPGAALYVGDDYRLDVVGARAAGLTPVLVDRNDRYLETDCIKIRSLDEILDILEGRDVGSDTAEVCFSGYSL